MPFFFATANEPLQLLGWKALFVHIELFHQALDRRELVLRVQNLKALRQIRHFVMRPQEAVAQAMKGANPHAAHVHRQHARQAREHLFGRLIGKSDGHYTAGRDLPGLHEPGDPRGEHARFARTRACEDERMFVGQSDGGELLGVEIAQQGHGGAFAGRGASFFRGGKQHAVIVPCLRADTSCRNAQQSKKSA